MKKVLIRLMIIVALLGCFVGIDLLSAKILDKPLLVLEEVESENHIKYASLYYDVYHCTVCESVNLVFKGSEFVCSNIEEHTKTAKLTLVGDLLFEQPYYDALDHGEDKSLYFNQVKDYFVNDDLTIANLEVPISDGTLETSGVGYSFCAPTWVGEIVAGLDFEVLGTSNNHTNDRGVAGINATIDFFEKNSDILTVGSYKNQDDRETQRILEINDITFGFLAYTYGTNVDPNYGDENLIGYYLDPHTSEITEEYKKIMKTEIEALRPNCDVLVVLMHWGNEFTYDMNDEQQEMAQFLNELKVDLIVGSHSHNIQPIEMMGDNHQTLVYYSLGNFVSADEDLDRTATGYETFDNAYNVGMLATLEVVKGDDGIHFQNMNSEMIVNYFDSYSRNWELVPFSNYSEDYEKTHQRYYKGLTKDFIQEMHESVIDEMYR